jgi:class 3 adenylate cyclase
VSGLPGGAVTFLFTDIEGSTRLVKALRDRYAQVLADHQRLVRAAIAGHDGHEVDTQGDAFFAAFASAKQAVLCALAIQVGLAGHAWPADGRVRVRIGIHTGNAVPGGGRYTGLAVHRAARICATARGGQVLVSQATQSIIADEEEDDPRFTLADLGEQKLKDLDRPVRLFQLTAPGAGRHAACVARPGGGRGGTCLGAGNATAAFRWCGSQNTAGGGRRSGGLGGLGAGGGGRPRGPPSCGGREHGRGDRHRAGRPERGRDRRRSPQRRRVGRWGGVGHRQRQ